MTQGRLEVVAVAVFHPLLKCNGQFKRTGPIPQPEQLLFQGSENSPGIFIYFGIVLRLLVSVLKQLPGKSI
jgi:hypothetical protein